MSLKAQIEADLKTAMLARDEFTTTTLRGLKAVILNEEVAKGLRDEGLSDETIEQLIARETKKRDESARLFEQGGNQSSADNERAEKQLLAAYLPKQLDEAALRSLVADAVTELKAEGMKDMGKVINAVKAKTGTSGDGSVIARLVKEALQG
jgi:uncharacterized protein